MNGSGSHITSEDVEIRLASESTDELRTPLLLGSNLEMGQEVAEGLLSDRLRNPKFLGPEDPLRRMPHPWFPVPPLGRALWNAELTQGIGMAGTESLMLQRQYGFGVEQGCVQTGVWVRAGESLEAELWAIAVGEPLQIRVSVRPREKAAAAYAEAELTIDKPYWARYTVQLQARSDDDDAEFQINLLTPGAMWLDQVHLRPTTGDLRGDALALISDFAPPVVRFPGGCLSTIYRWRFGTGPRELRPHVHDPIWNRHINYDWGIDEFLTLCAENDIIPQFTIAIGSATKEDAIDWATYCADWFRARGMDLPLIYWQFGNEQWGNHEPGHTTPEQYVALLREWVPELRRAYPNARVIALGQEKTPIPEQPAPPWRRIILANAAGCFDVIAVQLYCFPDGTWPVDEEPKAERLRAEAAQIAADMSSAIADCDELAPACRVALTEWNLFSAATAHGRYVEPADGAHVLFTAAVLRGLCGLGERLELANHYSLLNWFGAIQVNGPVAEATPIAHLLRLYRKLLPGYDVPVDIESDLLAAICFESEDRGGRWMIVENWSASRNIEISLAPEWQPTSIATIWADSLRAVAAVSDERTVSGNSLTLPRLSVSRIRLARR
jgi:alpha-L-arabinofuranosidase